MSTEYKIRWKFTQDSWQKGKKKPLKFEGEMTGGIHPYTDKDHVEGIVADLNRTYGPGTHWVEEIK